MAAGKSVSLGHGLFFEKREVPRLWSLALLTSTCLAKCKRVLWRAWTTTAQRKARFILHHLTAGKCGDLF